MVLPEGVLNNKNLQAVREYFEGKAKLILICSIPQDVFIAAGATVKPSLVFMRKFTDTEEKAYTECKQKAIDEVTALHQTELDTLNNTIGMYDNLTNSLKDDLKDAKDRLQKIKKAKKDTSVVEAEIADIQQKQKDNKNIKMKAEKELVVLQKLISEEIKPVIKKYFDYDIPIAKIEDAGITTTGAKSEGNQLPTLVEEYREYNKLHSLWISSAIQYSYKPNSTGCYSSYVDAEEVRKL